MLRLVFLETKKQKKQYVKFISSLYRHNDLCRDISSQLVSAFLSGKSTFCNKAKIIPVAVLNHKNDFLCAATFIIADKMPDTLQISFLEISRNGQEAFALILEAARQKARHFQAKKIVAGLNGHVNYGMGFLADHFDTPQSFGAAYNTPEYIEALEKNGGQSDYQVSFLIDVNAFQDKWQAALNTKGSGNLTYRLSNFKNFKQEMKIYTDLNNEIFKGHPLYFERDYEDDLELMKALSWLLHGENLIIAQDQDKPVGFLLWYPDFNELIKKGESLGLKTVIKNKLFGHRIQRFKIVEIGVLPQYHGKGVSWGLLRTCSQLVKGRYPECETGWIFDENEKSRGLAETWEGSYGKSIRLYKKYCVVHYTI